MQSTPSTQRNSKATPILRVIVELDGAELKVYPIVENDADEHRILDALRFYREDRQ
jgi:hypothetical protein